MPFTFCHAAAVIPLHRWARTRTSLPALVIGSMMPDSVYFFPVGVSGAFTHSLAGVPAYAIPAGALVLWIYYALLRQPLLAWAPAAIATRMTAQVRPFPRSAGSAFVLIASLALGAATHLGWDAFTHANTALVNRFDVLRSPLSIGDHAIPAYNLLQHLSSLLGFIVIASYTLAWLARTPAAPVTGPRLTRTQRLHALLAVVFAGAAGGAAGWLLRPAVGLEHALFNITVSAIAAAALVLVLLCIGWKVSGADGAASSPG